GELHEKSYFSARAGRRFGQYRSSIGHITLVILGHAVAVILLQEGEGRRPAALPLRQDEFNVLRKGLDVTVVGELRVRRHHPQALTGDVAADHGELFKLLGTFDCLVGVHVEPYQPDAGRIPEHAIDVIESALARRALVTLKVGVREHSAQWWTE